MLSFTLISILLALAAVLLSAAGTAPNPRKIQWATAIPTELRRLRATALAAARGIHRRGFGKGQWQRGVLNLVICTTATIAVLVSIGFYHVYFNRSHLPDIEPFARFEFPTIGTVYDTGGQPLIELAKEYRKIAKYEDIPPIVRDAIIAAEDKRFFSHSGVDYSIIPRLLSKVRMGAFAAGLVGFGRQGEAASPALLPHGGSTITQQLVRGHFLKNLTAKENSHQLQYDGISSAGAF